MEFQVLSSTQFTVEVKYGLFVELFNSPFQGDVIGLFLHSNSNAAGLAVDVLNKYKSSKTIWVELEPGIYSLQIVLMRQIFRSD